MINSVYMYLSNHPSAFRLETGMESVGMWNTSSLQGRETKNNQTLIIFREQTFEICILYHPLSVIILALT